MLNWFRPQPALPRRVRLSEKSWPGIVYAIGDVHGCLDQLLELEALIARDCQEHGLPALTVTLGDYVDRGPASAGVLDHLVLTRPSVGTRVCLAGNHEIMMLDFLSSPRHDHMWLANGGTETLQSYGLDVKTLFQGGKRRTVERLASVIPVEHLEFLAGLPVSLALPGYVLVHAGMVPGRALEEQLEDDMLWMRIPAGPFPQEPYGTIVHGHTPGPRVVVEEGRVCVDTSAFASGILTAMRISGPGEYSFMQTGRA